MFPAQAGIMTVQNAGNAFIGCGGFVGPVPLSTKVAIAQQTGRIFGHTGVLGDIAQSLKQRFETAVGVHRSPSQLCLGHPAWLSLKDPPSGPSAQFLGANFGVRERFLALMVLPFSPSGARSAGQLFPLQGDGGVHVVGLFLASTRR